MEDIFRALFGLTNRHDIFRRPKDMSITDDTTEDTDDSVVNEDDRLSLNTPSGRADIFMFPFNMDEILQQFVGGIFINIPDIIKDMDSLEVLERVPAEKNRSLRDEMLKEDSADGIAQPSPEPRRKQDGFWQRYVWPKNSPSRIEADQAERFLDTDLDSAVRSHGLDSVLRSSTGPSRETEEFLSRPTVGTEPSRETFVYSFSSSSHSTYDGGNRKIVAKSTTRNVDGCQETVVTRCVDGETVTERVRRDKKGRVIESVVESSSKGLENGPRNEPGERLRSERAWIERPAGKEELVYPSATHRRDNADSIFKNIFGFDYPGWDNDI